MSGSFRLPGQGVSETPPALIRRAWLEAVRRLLPPLVAGTAVVVGNGDAGDGLLAAIVVYVSYAFLLRVDFPLQLTRVSPVALAFAGPLLAASVIALAAALGSGDAPSVRDAFLVPVLSGFAGALLGEFIYRAGMKRRPIRMAAIGASEFAAGLAHELAENDISYIEWLGLLELGELDGPELEQRLRQETAERSIDVLVYGPGTGEQIGEHESSPLFLRVAEACIDLRVRLMSGNQLYEEVFGHVPLGTIDSAWYLFIVHPNFAPPPTLFRRLFDLAIAVPVALLAAPLLALAAIAIRIEGPGGTFYRQTRVGERGRHFEILKLRTMRPDAEAGGIQFSRAGDSRVTRVGRILRRTHLDEVPQVLNVLRGEMGFVGPRPERPEIVAEMEQIFPRYSRRHHIKPGVTGWAQIRCGYAGSTLGTAWKLCHDLYYVKHRSLVSDTLIMIETAAIAARDAHRPLRVPESQFVIGRSLGIDTEIDEAGGVPEPGQLFEVVRGPSKT